MIELDNATSLHVPLEQIETIANTLCDSDIELLVVDTEQMRAINAEHRQIDKATDVLSFPFEALPMAPLGSLVICSEYVRDAAVRFGHSEDAEFTLLFIHGLLHLLGYDHEVDEGEMRDKEAEIIRDFDLPASLIIRTQEN